MTTVNTLLNTHLDIVRELETLSEKVDKLEQDAETLSETHPERAEEVRVREVGGCERIFGIFQRCYSCEPL